MGSIVPLQGLLLQQYCGNIFPKFWTPAQMQNYVISRYLRSVIASNNEHFAYLQFRSTFSFLLWRILWHHSTRQWILASTMMLWQESLKTLFVASLWILVMTSWRHYCEMIIRRCYFKHWFLATTRWWLSLWEDLCYCDKCYFFKCL